MGKKQSDNQNKEKDNFRSPKQEPRTVTDQALLNMVASGSDSHVIPEEVPPGTSGTTEIQRPQDIKSAIAPTEVLVGDTVTKEVPLDSQKQVGGSIPHNEPQPGPGPSGLSRYDDSKKKGPLQSIVDGSTNNYLINYDKAAIMSAVAPTEAGNIITKEVSLDSQKQVGGSIPHNEPQPGPSGLSRHDDSKKKSPLQSTVHGSNISKNNLVNDVMAATKSRKRTLSPSQPGPSNGNATLGQGKNADTDSSAFKRFKESVEQPVTAPDEGQPVTAPDEGQPLNAPDEEQPLHVPDGEQEVLELLNALQEGGEHIIENEELAIRLLLQMQNDGYIPVIVIGGEEAMDEETLSAEQLEDVKDNPIINTFKHPNKPRNNEDSDDEGNPSLPV